MYGGEEGLFKRDRSHLKELFFWINFIFAHGLLMLGSIDLSDDEFARSGLCIGVNGLFYNMAMTPIKPFSIDAMD